MYDFLFQEGVWLEIFISSGITALATTVTGLIAYNLTLRKAVADIAEIKKSVGHLNEELVNGTNDLKHEHTDLKYDYSDLKYDHSDSKYDHTRIIEKVDETKKVVFAMRDSIIESKATDASRYENLTDKQKAISDSLNNLNSMMDEMKRSATENHNLTEKNNMLSAQNQF